MKLLIFAVVLATSSTTMTLARVMMTTSHVEVSTSLDPSTAPTKRLIDYERRTKEVTSYEVVTMTRYQSCYGGTAPVPPCEGPLERKRMAKAVRIQVGDADLRTELHPSPTIVKGDDSQQGGNIAEAKGLLGVVIWRTTTIWATATTFVEDKMKTVTVNNIYCTEAGGSPMPPPCKIEDVDEMATEEPDADDEMVPAENTDIEADGDEMVSAEDTDTEVDGDEMVAEDTDIDVDGDEVVAEDTDIDVNGDEVVAEDTDIDVDGEEVVAEDTDIDVDGEEVVAEDTDTDADGYDVVAEDTDTDVDGDVMVTEDTNTDVDGDEMVTEDTDIEANVALSSTENDNIHEIIGDTEEAVSDEMASAESTESDETVGDIEETVSDIEETVSDIEETVEDIMASADNTENGGTLADLVAAAEETISSGEVATDENADTEDSVNSGVVTDDSSINHELSETEESNGSAEIAPTENNDPVNPTSNSNTGETTDGFVDISGRSSLNILGNKSDTDMVTKTDGIAITPYPAVTNEQAADVGDVDSHSEEEAMSGVVDLHLSEESSLQEDSDKGEVMSTNSTRDGSDNRKDSDMEEEEKEDKNAEFNPNDLMTSTDSPSSDSSVDGDGQFMDLSGGKDEPDEEAISAMEENQAGDSAGSAMSELLTKVEPAKTTVAPVLELSFTEATGGASPPSMQNLDQTLVTDSTETSIMDADVMDEPMDDSTQTSNLDDAMMDESVGDLTLTHVVDVVVMDESPDDSTRLTDSKLTPEEDSVQTVALSAVVMDKSPPTSAAENEEILMMTETPEDDASTRSSVDLEDAPVDELTQAPVTGDVVMDDSLLDDIQ